MSEKTKEYRKELAELFIRSLEEKQLDWKKEWSGRSLTPCNAKSKSKYKGINHFLLRLIAMERGYTDPRWATYKQIEDMGAKLVDAKGKGVKVEYWFPYDKQEKHKISWEDFRILAQGVPNERYTLVARYSVVFNAAHIDGLKALPEPEEKEISIDHLVNTLSQNMGVEIINDGEDRAFYRSSEDKIHLPKPGFFYSDYAYNSTALHELAHATGAAHRLNRPLGNGFGSSEYAFEELIAEISSCFMSANLKIEQDVNHIENHKAYVQSWIQAIQEKPEMLVRAIAEAEKTTSYMEYKAGLLEELEYEMINSSVKEISDEKLEMVVLEADYSQRIKTHRQQGMRVRI